MQANRIGVVDHATLGKLSDAAQTAARSMLDLEIRNVGEILLSAGNGCSAADVEAALMQATRLLRLHRAVQAGQVSPVIARDLTPMMKHYREVTLTDVQHERDQGHGTWAEWLMEDVAGVDRYLSDVVA